MCNTDARVSPVHCLLPSCTPWDICLATVYATSVWIVSSFQFLPIKLLNFFFFFLFRAAPMAYGDSQASGLIGAVATGTHHSHSHTRSKLHLQSTPQLTTILDL